MEQFWFYLTLMVPVWLLGFGVAETYALATGRMPLTDWIREKLGIIPPEPRRRWMAPLFAFVLGAFTVWFIPHIEWGFW